MPLDPNIVMGIKPFTPPDLAAIRQAGDERIHQNRVNKSNLQTADLNRRAAESNLAKSNQDIQLGVLKSMVLDAGAVRKLMGSSDVVPELNQHIGATLANLVSRTERIGGDPSLWKRWAMLDTTDRSAAMEFYDKVLLRIFEAENPELFKSEILSDSDVTAQGQVIRQGPDGGLSAMDVDNFKGAPQESFATEMRGGVPVQVSSTSGREFESPRVAQGPSTVVNVAGQENAANSTYGASIGDRASERINYAQEAISQNAQLDRVLMAMERGAQTGTGEETILNMKNMGQTFLGMSFENVPEQEVIRTVQNEMALRLRNPDSGLGLTGSTSNRDLDFLKNSVIGLARSEGGNALIIDFMKRKNQMRIDLADEQAKLIEENDGQVPSNLDSKLLKFANEYSLFSTAERRALERASGGLVLPGLSPEEQAEYDALELELAQ